MGVQPSHVLQPLLVTFFRHMGWEADFIKQHLGFNVRGGGGRAALLSFCMSQLHRCSSALAAVVQNWEMEIRDQYSETGTEFYALLTWPSSA